MTQSEERSQGQAREKPQGGATISAHEHTNTQKEPQHPYMVATITPGGGIIVNMYWMDQPMEPMAFTNDSDFAAWLKGAMKQLAVGRLPPGIRPNHSHAQVRERDRRGQLPTEYTTDSIEYAPIPNMAPRQQPSFGARLTGMLSGGRS